MNFKNMRMKTLFFIYLLFASGVQAQENGSDILGFLQTYDKAVSLRQSSNRVLLVSFVMKVTQKFNPAVGVEIRYCEAALANDFCVIKMKVEYPSLPHFSKGNKEMDYDSFGNVVVWRSLEKYYTFSYERNQLRDELMCLTIDSQDRVATNRFTKLYKYALGNPENIYIIDQLRLATGLGTSKFLDQAGQVKNDSELSASGNYGSRQGTWKISFDSANDYLVRRAEFSGSGPQITNSGLIKIPGLTLASIGTFSYSTMYKAEFTVQSATQVSPDSLEFRNLCRDVAEHMDALLPTDNSEIVDFRGEKPKVGPAAPVDRNFPK